MTTSDSIEKETTSARWSSQGWVPTWTYIPVHNERHQLVCSVYPTAGSYDDATRHARLIAAAPELYEALAEIELQWLPYSDADLERFARMNPDEGGVVQPHWAEKILAARRALRKARGEDRSHEGK